MSTPMALSVWVFALDSGAQRATLQLGARGRLDLRICDVGGVSWPIGQHRPVTWQARDLGDQRLAGAFWGLLFSSLFLLPLTQQGSLRRDHDSHPSSAALLGTGLTALGLDEGFITRVRVSVVPGTSALFVFDSAGDSDVLARTMPPQAQRVTRSVLTVAQGTRLHAGFADQP